MIPNADDAWPLSCEPADEWAGDEWLDDLPSSYSNYQNLGGKLSETAYAEADAAWLERYRAVLRGEATEADPELRRLSHELFLIGDRSHDRRPARVAPEAIPPTLLADIGEDYVPDAGLLAADRFLGPWADAGPPRAALKAAAGNLCFLPLMDYGGTPRSRWSHGARPKPELSLRQAVHAAARAPVMLYRVEADGRWTPLLPLGELFHPEGPVQAEIADLVPGRRAAILGRAWPCEEGHWAGECALGVPELPPLGALERRLDLELLRLRRHERRSTWEDLLRRRPEVLYRFCTSYAWWLEEERCIDSP
ncbi:MAG: hypothetical protein H6741_00950 [Alphaproteobacteria bacterium]|nr:hypothetical protein [Alphaproteobacteria bacterium]